MKKGFKSAWSSLKNSKTGMFGLILVLLIIICAIFAPLLAPYDPLAQDVMIKLKDPIWGADPVAGHLLGTSSSASPSRCWPCLSRQCWAPAWAMSF